MRDTDILREMSGFERFIFSLRALYGKSGYRQYQMSKFEEYDLYARYRDFLASEQIISFTDTDGRLMALKPDVTLSIIKNLPDRPEELQKLYYDERVYRVSQSSGRFQELRQLGLECMGTVDDASLLEILTLACLSLQQIGALQPNGSSARDAVLELSQIDILKELLDDLKLDRDQRDRLVPVIQSKNLPGLKQLLTEFVPSSGPAIAHEASGFLQQLIAAPGDPKAMIALLRTGAELISQSSADQLEELVEALPEDLKSVIRIDFSLTGNSRYYNGIIFQGFVQGVPQRVLAGGQYDRMMERMGRRSRACGFALYLNLLDRMFEEKKGI